MRTCTLSCFLWEWDGARPTPPHAHSHTPKPYHILHVVWLWSIPHEVRWGKGRMGNSMGRREKHIRRKKKRRRNEEEEEEEELAHHTHPPTHHVLLSFPEIHPDPTLTFTHYSSLSRLMPPAREHSPERRRRRNIDLHTYCDSCCLASGFMWFVLT